MAIDLFSVCLGAVWGAMTVIVAAVLLAAYAGASTLTRIEEEEFKE